MRVGAGPLDVKEIFLSGNDEIVGNEIVFDRRIHLHDVTSFPFNVQVDDATTWG